MTLSQTVRQMMDNLHKSKLFLRPWEKGQPCAEGTKQQLFNISETHKLRRKKWAKQDTRELNHFKCVPVKRTISWSRRTLKAPFFFFWSTVELCSAITSQKCLGDIILRIMTGKPLEWECNICLNIMRILWKYFQNIDFQGDQEKLSPKDLQVNSSL